MVVDRLAENYLCQCGVLLVIFGLSYHHKVQIRHGYIARASLVVPVDCYRDLNY